MTEIYPDDIDWKATALDLAARLKAVANLHGPAEVLAISEPDCVNEECYHDDECPTTAVKICGECARIAEEVNPYYMEERLEAVLFPCPTWEASEDK